jgi:hypothetical protein
MYPPNLSLAGQPGGRIEVDLVVANVGNVGCELRELYVFGLFETQGVESAIGRSLRAELAENERRADRLVDELAASHGGLVRVSVLQGAGELAPQEVRDLRVAFHLPNELKTRRAYSGTIPIHNLRYYVRIEVAEAPAERSAKNSSPGGESKRR